MRGQLSSALKGALLVRQEEQARAEVEASKRQVEAALDKVLAAQTQTKKLAAELTTVAKVSTAAATILEATYLLQTVVDLTKTSFGLYHAHIYLLNPAGDTLILAAGAGNVGRQMVIQGWSIPLQREQSLVARAARTRQGGIVNNVRNDPNWLPNPLLPHTRAELAVPLLVGEQVLGVLDVQADEANYFSEEDIHIQITLAETEDKVKGFEVGGVDYVTKPIQQEEVLARVTTHLKIRNLTRELRQANAALAKRALQLEASHQVGQQVTSILDLDSLLVEVIRLIQAKFGYYSVSIWLLTNQSASVALQVGTVREAQLLPTPSLSIPLATNQSIIASVCRSGQAYLANDVSLDDPYLASEIFAETRSELALPLRLGEEMIGVLDIKSDQPATFDDEDKTILQTLANQIAIAIRNARLYEMEKKLNADKDKFFSIISHDLRGPFHNMLGNAHLMLETMERLSRQDIKEMTHSIYNGAKAAHGLLENLLLWSRLQRGQMEYQPDRLKLYSLAQETVELLGEIAAQKNIHLHHTIQTDLYVYADRHMMSTVIRNLTNNALKFTPSGGMVILSAQPGRGPENGARAPATSPDFVTVWVSDTGVGIKPEDMAELFSIGVHHSTLGTNKERGTGLGLILCKEMVEQNGGRIWIESQVGQGTKVQFTVPTQP